MAGGKESAMLRTSVEIKLDFPVDMDGATVGVLTMRRPKVRDQLMAQKQAGNDPAKTEILLFSFLCEVAPSSMEELDIADYEKLREAYSVFRAGLSQQNP